MTKAAKKPIHILVADDDAAIVEVVTLLLEDEGYHVSSTYNGATITDVNDSLPDLILMDIWMSGMDGSEIVKRLKADARTKHIPIIMFSANRDCEAIANEAGADDHLLKPFDIETLLSKVKRLVSARPS